MELASDSKGSQYLGAVVKAVRQRVREHRRQSWFVRDTNHKISKELAQRASSLSSKAFALEDLSDIRERANDFGRQMRRLMEQYRDASMGLVDAPLVAAAETPGVQSVFTLDKYFYVYRLPNAQAFSVVP